MVAPQGYAGQSISGRYAPIPTLREYAIVPARALLLVRLRRNLKREQPGSPRSAPASLGQHAHGIAFEVFRLAVRRKSVRVPVLLIDEHRVRDRPPHGGNVTDASGSWREAVASKRKVSATSSRSSGANFNRTVKLINEPASSCVPNYACMLSNAAANSGSSIVWSRSGPVDTIPILAPLSRS